MAPIRWPSKNVGMPSASSRLKDARGGTVGKDRHGDPRDVGTICYRRGLLRRSPFELNFVLGAQRAWFLPQMSFTDSAKTLHKQGFAALRTTRALEFVKFVKLAARTESGDQRQWRFVFSEHEANSLANGEPRLFESAVTVVFI